MSEWDALFVAALLYLVGVLTGVLLMKWKWEADDE